MVPDKGVPPVYGLGDFFFNTCAVGAMAFHSGVVRNADKGVLPTQAGWAFFVIGAGKQ